MDHAIAVNLVERQLSRKGYEIIPSRDRRYDVKAHGPKNNLLVCVNHSPAGYALKKMREVADGLDCILIRADVWRIPIIGYHVRYLEIEDGVD